jgi:leucyl/phenylalanyl-tRNA--protein transferase
MSPGSRRLTILPVDAPVDAFPHPARALDDPNGLLAAGGDLSSARLLAAYRQGIFPWFSDGEPVLWWSPDPRVVLEPGRLRVHRSFAKRLRQARYQLSVDRAFDDVIAQCAAPRARQPGTWITDDMRAAYCELHRLGHAHSIECWQDGALVGGLYGVAVGRVFCGESMFSRAVDASKVALWHLCRLGFALIDGQVENPFLSQMGFVPIPRADYLGLLSKHGREPVPDLQRAAAVAAAAAGQGDAARGLGDESPGHDDGPAR